MKIIKSGEKRIKLTMKFNDAELEVFREAWENCKLLIQKSKVDRVFQYFSNNTGSFTDKELLTSYYHSLASTFDISYMLWQSTDRIIFSKSSLPFVHKKTKYARIIIGNFHKFLYYLSCFDSVSIYLVNVKNVLNVINKLKEILHEWINVAIILNRLMNENVALRIIRVGRSCERFTMEIKALMSKTLTELDVSILDDDKDIVITNYYNYYTYSMIVKFKLDDSVKIINIDKWRRDQYSPLNIRIR